ncbi:VOC family protein [Neobacillus ginsengisoli]|uniref:3-demethylubiquinone-9 3-methyltransferase (Glyoxalase superfamily) n=1 Tax=Neobacillus ginsengisoli TaxID=904295 RepID=A0ABT9XY58_9BACI|nr:VOC family protein [Neobacillus ginsengisoli]MDQ0200439.1 putative 3-demethylubiquinone-9 3-methyltransferase (glyoxalase superfamily) [Neobacillus ginsengisoli]
MNQKITTFLMFSGKAEEAMNFYTSVFDHSEINSVFHHENGTVLHAVFTLKGQRFMCIDNSSGQEHSFTPAMSLFVTCASVEEIDGAFEKLSQDGQVLMPLAASPFSEKFGWVQDKYGVSWQLNLAEK